VEGSIGERDERAVHPPRRTRIRVINAPAGDAGESADLLPLAACDCDNDGGVKVCVGDIDADVDACGVWG
jgi:hypothetical protein